jgi:hydroxyethylthiazole kinase-like uncharacterized protein yjeF
MPRHADQILTLAQMRAAEQALIDAGSSVDTLMQRAGQGAADWVWRIAAQHRVTVLCGPGNNGGDGYVIAEAIRARGGKVAVLPAAEPKTDAARNARALYRGALIASDAEVHGEVFVDCLFGSGLTRPLSQEHVALLGRLAAGHRHSIAIDLPSGVDSDTGALLNPDLPRFDLTIALGAWKFAHWLMPASARLGALQLVDIGIASAPGAAQRLQRPRLSAPAADSHKYRRGLLVVVRGAMPGASVLAAVAAQGAGAGYVKLLCGAATGSVGADLVITPDVARPERVEGLAPDLVQDFAPLGEALADDRIAALIVGPGLGRDGRAQQRLATALAADKPTVIDADALLLLDAANRSAPTIATPHDGEFNALEKTFGCVGSGSKVERARALSAASGMVIVAKGPDTVIAAPDGRLVCASGASSWLSVAGTGDVLAGAIASRLATGIDPFTAACQGVWLHGEAAGLAGPAFTASGLALYLSSALAACL